MRPRANGGCTREAELPFAQLMASDVTGEAFPSLMRRGFVASIAMWPNLGRGLVIMMNGVDRQLMGEINNAFMEQYIASVRR